MKTWFRRMRGALGMGVTWAVGWALAGIMIGVASIVLPFLPWDAFFRVFDAPLPALAVPGFVGGTLFSIVLRAAGGKRRFDQLSMPLFAAWGAAGGVLLSLIPDAMVAVGLATPADWVQLPLFLNPRFLLPIVTLSTLSATGTLALARRAEDRELRHGDDETESVGLAPGEARDLLGARLEPIDTPTRSQADARRR